MHEYLAFMRHFAVWNQCKYPADWDYAVYLLRKYYTHGQDSGFGRSNVTAGPSDYPNVGELEYPRSYSAERIQESAASLECDKFFTAGYVPPLPAQVSDEEGTGSV